MPGPLVEEIWFHGGDLDDTFVIDTDVPSFANGKGGTDCLTGGSSRVEILGGTGGDVLSGREGSDTLDGGLGSDKSFGGARYDKLRVVATGHDADMNTLCGGSGADDLDETDIGSAKSQLDDGDGAAFANTLRDDTYYEYTAPTGQGDRE